MVQILGMTLLVLGVMALKLKSPVRLVAGSSEEIMKRVVEVIRPPTTTVARGR